MTLKKEGRARSAGLGCRPRTVGIFTRDSTRSLRMVKELKAGVVRVNTYRVVSPIAEAGGMKHSGHGRESGFQAMYDDTRPKTAWMNTSDQPLASQFVAR